MSSVPRPDDKRPSSQHEETIVNSSAGSGSSSPGSSGFSLHPGMHETSKAVQTVEEFSQNLTASGLMSADELKSFCDTIPSRDTVQDAESFAAILVKANKLTSYQAESLKQGHTRGLVLGNYVILDKLGEGGMGMVFKARHRLMKRIVALKVLPPSMTQSADAVNRFHREVEVAAKLTHPNIAAAHDADQADGIHFLVMEYVEGPNLSALVKEIGPLSPAIAMNIVAQSAKGLAHAHEHGVVHRDIKPGNLLVGRDGVVKVLDMGLAQLQSSEQNSGEKAELTQSGRIMGTVDYMAPEQALDAKTVDSRADIYSLGCTLFYLLAGRPMSPEGTLTQKLLWHQTETVPSLKSVSPEVPDALEDIFQRMVAKKPEARPNSMSEVVATLEPLLASIPAEQLQLPAGVGLSADAGSATDAGRNRGRLTLVDRQTRTDLGYDDSSLPPLPPPVAPTLHASSLQRLLPVAVVLGILGIAAGIALFMFVAPPGKAGGNNNPIAAATDGKLIVEASHPNARVFINGQERGQTNGAKPYQLEVSLPPGEYQVRVEKEGLKTFEDKIALQVGKPYTLNASLGAKPALADIIVEIAGVQVSVDGRAQGSPTGKGPYHLTLALDPGEHLIRYEAQGYEGKEEKLIVKSGEKFEHPIALTERPYRALLSLIFKNAHPDVEAPVTLVDAAGQLYAPKRWSDVPAKYREVREIDLSRSSVQKEELPLLARAETLQSLSLADTAIDDEGVRELAELKTLTRLDLRNTPITDKGLARLTRLEALRELDLRGTKVGDAGMESLAALPLETIRLSGTTVGDAGVQKLAAVKSLRALVVDGTRVTEDGYEALGKAFAKNPIDKNDLDPELSLARKLLRGGAKIVVVPAVSTAEPAKSIDDAQDLPSERFYIAGISASGSRAVDDTVMRELKPLPMLTDVDLDGSAVTDDGLAQLRQVATLRKVNLGYLRVAKASVDSLRQALPDAEVAWQGPRDRVAAEWVIQQGGTVRISASPSRLAKQLSDLPENRDFRLEEVHLVNKPEIPEADFAVIKELSDLRLLNLVGTSVTAQALEQMTGCPQVKTLALGNEKIDSAAATAIVERFPLVERLYLADTAIDGQGLNQLKKLSELQQLSLAGTPVQDADLESLAAFPKLMWLSLDGAPLSDGAVPHLAKLKKLKVLSLDDALLGETDQMLAPDVLPKQPARQPLMISDAGIEELQAALKTTKIQARPLDPQRLVARWVLEQGGAVVVAENAYTTAKVDKPSDLPRVACKVREVSLRNSARLQPDQLAAKLRECQELRSLDLSGNAGLVDRHIASLGTLKTLESLYLAKTGVTDSAFEKLGALPELKVLGLQGTLVSGSGLVKHPLPKLTHLYAGTTDFSDATLKGLKDSTDLLVLDLSNCKLVTDRGMPELASFSKLEQLDLSLTRVTDQSGAVLGKLTQLKKLNLYGLPVTDALVSQLSGLAQLEEIILAKTKVGDGALAPLSGIKSLRRISVWGTSVTDAAAQPLRDRGVEVNKSADPAQRDANGGTGF